jgi:hypothetical protein
MQMKQVVVTDSQQFESKVTILKLTHFIISHGSSDIYIVRISSQRVPSCVT